MAQQERSVCIPIDDSPHSRRALTWAASNLIRPGDKLNLLCVQTIFSDPFAVEATATPFSDQLATAGLDSHRVVQASQACASTLQSFRQAAVAAGVPEARIATAQVSPSGGASGVGESIVQYAEQTGQDMLVMGSRGMGAVQRAFFSAIGLGSVSDFTVDHVHCPVVVVKTPLQGVNTRKQ